MSKYTCVDYI
ncbi:MAG: hypothetical protein E6Q37_07310 [Crocinitomicaceae bacterium]|nr:MAG: hypothetical protein E6Q37_07310 [Crocinitomicaceae bacterium]